MSFSFIKYVRLYIMSLKYIYSYIYIRSTHSTPLLPHLLIISSTPLYSILLSRGITCHFGNCHLITFFTVTRCTLHCTTTIHCIVVVLSPIFSGSPQFSYLFAPLSHQVHINPRTHSPKRNDHVRGFNPPLLYDVAAQPLLGRRQICRGLGQS